MRFDKAHEHAIANLWNAVVAEVSTAPEEELNNLATIQDLMNGADLIYHLSRLNSKWAVERLVALVDKQTLEQVADNQELSPQDNLKLAIAAAEVRSQADPKNQVSFRKRASEILR
jgi:pyocin large subunit-like protein